MGRVCRIEGPGGAVVEIGGGRPLVVIAGPCTLESEALALEVGRRMASACAEAGLPYIFKASFDKANRTSVTSPRGPGLASGLATLASVREQLGVPVTTDLHEAGQAEAVAAAVDVLQIPAFLCRQTDLLVAASRAASERGRAVNIKKGQFLSPEEMRGPIGKCEDAGCRNLLVTERGTFFGYHRLVNDFIGVGDLLELPAEGGPVPVCFDATHSAQLPGATATTGGRRERVAGLARAASAVGVHALFLECHPTPSRALSDASTMLDLDEAAEVVSVCARVSKLVRGEAGASIGAAGR